jgi:3',5'-cyclic-AMP phosphodiesterase
MLVAHLSDTHARPEGAFAYGIVDTNAALARAVDAVLALRPRPDAVLISGDLAHEGLAEEYRVLRRQLDRLAPVPVHVVPGNHDRRDELRAAFPDRPRLREHPVFVQYAADLGPLRLLALDTVVPGRDHGELCPERLAWLDARLAEAPDRPALVMMHHPPIACGIGHMDDIACRDADALGGVIGRHRHVERVLCGHHHRPIQARWRGTLVSVAPSVAHQVALDLEPGAEAAFTLEPPAFHVHRWTPGVGLVTHQAYVGPYPGPHPFALDPG